DRRHDGRPALLSRLGPGVAPQLSRAQPARPSPDRSARPVGAAVVDRAQFRSVVSGVQRAAGSEALPRTGGSSPHLVMLQQELPRIDSSPLEAWSRWLMPALIGAAGLTVAIPLALAGQLALAGIAAAAGLAGGAIALVRGSRGRPFDEPIVAGPDYALVGS